MSDKLTKQTKIEVRTRALLASRMTNKARRVNMVRRVVELKIDTSKLSSCKKEAIKRIFLESKWIKNAALAFGAFDYKLGDKVTVMVFNPESNKCDIPEERELTIGSQLRQQSAMQVQKDITNLAKAKKRGRKVGKVKFYKSVDSVTLPQYGVTYTQCTNHKFFKLQKVGKVRVHGIDQLDKYKGTYEFAEAKLVSKPSGYYLKVLIYVNKPPDEVIPLNLGGDLGVKDDLTTSDGTIYSTSVPLPDKVRRTCMEASKKVKGSNGYKRAQWKKRKKYEDWTNQKKDKVKKIVSKLRKYKKVIIQDDNIKGWQRLWGTKVSIGARGMLKSELKKLKTCVVVSRFTPSTIECPCCYARTEQPLSQRYFLCLECNYYEPSRDVKGAKVTKAYGEYELNNSKSITNAERIGLPVEALTTVYEGYDFNRDRSGQVYKLAPSKLDAQLLAG